MLAKRGPAITTGPHIARDRERVLEGMRIGTRGPVTTLNEQPTSDKGATAIEDGSENKGETTINIDVTIEGMTTKEDGTGIAEGTLARGTEAIAEKGPNEHTQPRWTKKKITFANDPTAQATTCTSNILRMTITWQCLLQARSHEATTVVTRTAARIIGVHREDSSKTSSGIQGACQPSLPKRRRHAENSIRLSKFGASKPLIDKTSGCTTPTMLVTRDEEPASDVKEEDRSTLDLTSERTLRAETKHFWKPVSVRPALQSPQSSLPQSPQDSRHPSMNRG